ncbi:hypothetical protein EB151_01195 [archaeon]|nr:hypothetical protein [archaeon]
MPRSGNRLTSSGILLSYMKIVINKCYGGFGLSEEAVLLYAKKKGLNLIVQRDKGLKINHYYLNEKKDGNYFSERDIQRNDLILIEVVNELGEKADGFCSELKIVEIPDDVEWIIEEYDGKEWIAEDHRRWS